MTRLDTRIVGAKKNSGTTPVNLVLDSIDRREVFLFDNGELSEYELVRMNNHNIRLRMDELEGLGEFQFSV